MKKTYINPSIKVVKIEYHHQMLAGSLDPEHNRGTVSEESVTSGTAGEGRFFDFTEV